MLAMCDHEKGLEIMSHDNHGNEDVYI